MLSSLFLILRKCVTVFSSGLFDSSGGPDWSKACIRDRVFVFITDSQITPSPPLRPPSLSTSLERVARDQHKADSTATATHLRPTAILSPFLQ
ncbi:hypothetical protein TSUD_175500 [Trifolium subterraneum]|uniref:Secreted protein n=1 Tax=Trifolium subterraneum TaxID=3900 RepID=A0A2Z6PKQ5_TRISU|nr:hypothetical protein TSUD_175500 [Trifolium subterraneum]